MSAERSNSAVRNLRSIFETKESEAQARDQRSRSGSTEPGRERRPLSKVRSSFVAVEASRAMEDTTPKTETIVELEDDGVDAAGSAATRRRSSFSANTNDSEELSLKRTITHESEKRGRDTSVVEPIPEQAVESSGEDTPANTTRPVEPAQPEIVAETILPPANPDKPVTAVEEEPGPTKPALPTDSDAVTGGRALGEESLSKAEVTTQGQSSSAVPAAKAVPAPAKKTELPSAPSETKKLSKPDTKPAATATAKSSTSENVTPNQKEAKPMAASSAAGSAVKTEIPTRTDAKPITAPAAKASAPESTTPTKPVSKDLNRKASRTSLAASTASSAARNAANHAPMPTRTKPREPTKPVEISSHLLAPTAASRARQGEDIASNGAVKPASKPPRASLAAKPAPRASLAGRTRPGSGSETTTKPRVAPDESFLERMTRPTAASQNRAQDKFEVRSPPRKATAPTTAPKRTSATSTPAITDS